jgi:predicted transcriptional regulator
MEGQGIRTAHQLRIARVVFKVLSGKCWELLNAMTGAGAMSIREAARRVERDVKPCMVT